MGCVRGGLKESEFLATDFTDRHRYRNIGIYLWYLWLFRWPRLRGEEGAAGVPAAEGGVGDGVRGDAGFVARDGADELVDGDGADDFAVLEDAAEAVAGAGDEEADEAEVVGDAAAGGAEEFLEFAEDGADDDVGPLAVEPALDGAGGPLFDEEGAARPGRLYPSFKHTSMVRSMDW